MIPKIVHFIFGFSSSTAKRAAFEMQHYIAVKSAAVKHPGHKIVMWIGSEPTNNIYWELSQKYFEKVVVKPPTKIFGNPLVHYAHQADVFRLTALRDHGGIYLDCDTITLRSLGLIHCVETAMAPEWDPTRGRVNGLCNATIIARRNAHFISRWLDSYEFFNSRGKDMNWAFHSVQLPLILARQTSWDIAILPRNLFFKFDWSRKMLEDLFIRTTSVQDCYSIHLWESLAADFLVNLTVDKIFSIDSTYNNLVREIIGDDYSVILDAYAKK